MAEEAKRWPLQVTLRNRTDQTQLFLWDGMPYVFKPKQEITGIPQEIAGHFIGRHLVGLPVVPKMEDTEKSLLAEDARVKGMLGIDHTPPHANDEIEHPLMFVETVDPNLNMAAATQVLSTPVIEKEAEPQFADLKEQPKVTPDPLEKVLTKKG